MYFCLGSDSRLLSASIRVPLKPNEQAVATNTYCLATKFETFSARLASFLTVPGSRPSLNVLVSIITLFDFTEQKVSLLHSRNCNIAEANCSLLAWACKVMRQFNLLLCILFLFFSVYYCGPVLSYPIRRAQSALLAPGAAADICMKLDSSISHEHHAGSLSRNELCVLVQFVKKLFLAQLHT